MDFEMKGDIHHPPPKLAVAPTLSRAGKCRYGFIFMESTPLTSFPQLAHGRLAGEE